MKKQVRMARPAGRAADEIARSIFVLRGQRVILDSALAAIYCVSTGRLNEAVTRNLERFPSDFMFRVSITEHTGLRSLSAISKNGRGGRRYLPRVFTEHGAIQAANILNSRGAVRMSVYVVRAFVRLRDVVRENEEVARRLDDLEARVAKGLTKHDEAIAAIIATLRRLMNPPAPKRRGIGFTADIENEK